MFSDGSLGQGTSPSSVRGIGEEGEGWGTWSGYPPSVHPPEQTRPSLRGGSVGRGIRGMGWVTCSVHI